VRLLLLADTHVPEAGQGPPRTGVGEVERADLVVHAGDWVD
jgi:predicted phosphodiesterase